MHHVYLVYHKALPDALPTFAKNLQGFVRLHVVEHVVDAYTQQLVRRQNKYIGSHRHCTALAAFRGLQRLV